MSEVIADKAIKGYLKGSVGVDACVDLNLNYVECPKCHNSYALYFHRVSIERNGMCAHCYKSSKEKAALLDKQEMKLMDWVKGSKGARSDLNGLYERFEDGY